MYDVGGVMHTSNASLQTAFDALWAARVAKQPWP
jgi:hypothetical protein